MSIKRDYFLILGMKIDNYWRFEVCLSLSIIHKNGIHLFIRVKSCSNVDYNE